LMESSVKEIKRNIILGEKIHVVFILRFSFILFLRSPNNFSDQGICRVGKVSGHQFGGALNSSKPDELFSNR